MQLIGVNKSVAVSAVGMTPYVNYIAGIPSYPSFVPGMTLKHNAVTMLSGTSLSVALSGCSFTHLHLRILGPYSTFGDEMTFWERLYNFKIDLEMRYRFYFWEKDVWSVFNDAHPGFPDLKELFKVRACQRPWRHVYVLKKIKSPLFCGSTLIGIDH